MKKKKKNILIVVPSFQILGGVANHYQGLAPFWTNNVKYLFQGKRKHIPAIFTIIPDLITFSILMMFKKYDAVIINPSLRTYQLNRDSIYLRIARFFGKKVVTFIHGWDYDKADEISKSPVKFCNAYGKSSYIYVLYTGFKKHLESLPMSTPIELTTTKVNDALIKDFNIENRNGEINRILFLARADKLKGLDVTIKAFEILKKRYTNLELVICGTGNALNENIEYVNTNQINDVQFKGHVTGNDVAKEFANTDLYILPTTHGEGMPTSVLEAMAFGQPIITRPVGGLCDFFIDGKMGKFIESLNPQDYADAIEYYINNPGISKETSMFNHNYAKEHFLASSVARKIEETLEKYLNK